MNGYCTRCGAPWGGTAFCTVCGNRVLPQEVESAPVGTGGEDPPAMAAPSPEPPPPPVPASLRDRFLAFLADQTAILALAWLTAMTAVGAYRAGAGFLPQGDGAMSWWWTGVALVLGTAWHTSFIGKGGQTPGKRLLGLRVVGEEGRPLDYARAFVRVLGYLVSAAFLGVGFLWALWDPKRQAWHDKMARSVVVRSE